MRHHHDLLNDVQYIVESHTGKRLSGDIEYIVSSIIKVLSDEIISNNNQERSIIDIKVQESFDILKQKVESAIERNEKTELHEVWKELGGL